jgi:hypothetical protein
MDRLKNDGTSIFNRFMKPLTEVPFPLKGAIHPQLQKYPIHCSKLMEKKYYIHL